MTGVHRRRLAGKEASDVLPSELWLEILLRLPVRTLLILKCVSKTFLSLILNPNFPRLHFSRLSDSKNSDFVLIQREYASFADDSSIFQLDKYFLARRSYTPIEKTEFRFEVHYGTYCCVIGSVDGLFLLWKTSPSSSGFMLCNPSIMKCFLMPPPPSALLGEGNLGFGYDPISNDYKVVSIMCVEDNSSSPEDVEFDDDDDDDDYVNSESESEDDGSNESEDDEFENEPEQEDHSGRHLVEVFSFKKASWRTIGCNAISPGWFVESSIYANGKLHWLGGWDQYYFGQYDYYLSYVVTFDLGTELFSYSQLPNLDIDDNGVLSVKDDVKLLVSFQGSPAVFCLTSRDISFWVMRECNWTIDWRCGIVQCQNTTI